MLFWIALWSVSINAQKSPSFQQMTVAVTEEFSEWWNRAPGSQFESLQFNTPNITWALVLFRIQSVAKMDRAQLIFQKLSFMGDQTYTTSTPTEGGVWYVSYHRAQRTDRAVALSWVNLKLYGVMAFQLGLQGCPVLSYLGREKGIPIEELYGQKWKQNACRDW